MKGLPARRHHDARKKARVKKHPPVRMLLDDIEGGEMSFKEKKAIDRVVGRYARTPQPCSCMLCGNARRHFGKSRQEVKAERGEIEE